MTEPSGNSGQLPASEKTIVVGSPVSVGASLKLPDGMTIDETKLSPEPSTTAEELAPPMSNEELAGLYARTHHGDYDELKAAALWGLRSRDAEVAAPSTNEVLPITKISSSPSADDDTPLDERCFRAGVKEGRRLEREEWITLTQRMIWDQGKELANLEAEIAKLKIEVERLKRVDAQNDALRLSMEFANEEHEKKLTQLRQSLAKRDAAIEFLKKENADLNAAIPLFAAGKTEYWANLAALNEKLAESERKAAEMREALKECLDWMQWGTSPKDKTTAWHAMHARGCQAIAPNQPEDVGLGEGSGNV